MQNPSRCYFAVDDAHRQIFANCFSGNLNETSIKLKDATGAVWWGANGAYDLLQELDRTKLTAAEAWYAVIVFRVANVEQPDGIVFDSNCGFPSGMPDPGFNAFLQACGLTLWPPSPPNNNGTANGPIP